MEDQTNATTSPTSAPENGSITQEVSSTTQAVEPNKRSLRVQTWRKIQDNKCGTGFNAIFNRIPGFVDSDKAAALLVGTEEFKNAHNIKVNIDRALHAVKLETLIAGKTLYLPGTRESTALYLKVDVPEDATEEQKKEILHVQDVQQHRTEISLENKVQLDMVVIGSVVVSRDGYRIGRGNGFADLDIGLLIEIGAITPQTVIATMVHDYQVVDSLPINLFQKYDTPVDLIVTPTEVIRVANRLPRPTGLFWELLSERRLKIIPVLQTLKESQEKAGKVITLKEEDTDVEQNQNNRSRRRGPIRRRYGRRNQRRAVSQTDTEHQGGENAQQKRNPRRNRRFTNRRRRPTKSEGDQSGVEAKSQDRKSTTEKRQQRQRKQRPTNDFCIKLSNISRDVRVKDLKSELRKRECNPFYISWKGQYGKCYLHFGNRNGSPNTDEDINKVLKSLADLSLTVTTGGSGAGGNASGAEGDGVAPVAAQPQQTKTVNVNVELIKFDAKSTAKPTKRSLRDQTWRKIQENNLCTDSKAVFNRSPAFVDSHKAVALLTETDEFKNAQNIKVSIGDAVQALKLEALLAGKSLYLSGSRDSNALYLRFDVPTDATEEQKKEFLLDQDVKQHCTEISLDNVAKLDMIIIGSVVVSREGYRIGTGNDFTDRFIGLLIEAGAITADTIIVTLVHDVQVLDTLPANLFKKYDTPVDLIVTPTEVIRVANRLTRPLGIYWELLSVKNLKKMPILQMIKESYEKDGKIITLKAPAENSNKNIVKANTETIDTSTL